MRKTAATLANSATGDYHAVSEHLGHSSLEVTKLYVEQTDMQREKVANALDNVLMMPETRSEMGHLAPDKGARSKIVVISNS